MMEKLRLILLPLSWLFGLGVKVRNYLFESGWLPSIEFDIPTISVGNLSVGGTGKTPHTEYLIELITPIKPVAVLSRGFGRKTHGFRLADARSTAADIGDEPRQYKQKYPNMPVAVAENRALAIPDLLLAAPQTRAILLDDCYQHRQVKPGLSILLTEYDKPYSRDFLLPAGNLREPAAAANRADLIVVTKCPPSLTVSQKQQLSAELAPLPHQKVVFSFLEYGALYALVNPALSVPLPDKSLDVLLVCGIATPEPLIQWLELRVNRLHPFLFTDHHYFSRLDMERITESFTNFASSKKVIVTTEKDAQRLLLHLPWITANRLPIFVLPVKVFFREEDKAVFDTAVINYLEQSDY